MKRKSLVIFVLSFVLLFMQNTTIYAAESNNINQEEFITQKSVTRHQLLAEKYVVVEPNVPYISETFRPTTDQLYVLFTSCGQAGTSNTYYIEKKNSNGTWTVAYKYQLSGGYSKGTNEDVTPNDLYRVRVTDNSKYDTLVIVEAYELITE